MTNIAKARVTICGIRPLLQHRFTEAALPLEKQERTGVAGHDPEEWRKTCMVNKSGQLFLDPTYIFSALRNAGKHTRKGKGSIMADLAATLQVTDDVILLNRFFPGFPDDKQTFDVLTAEPPCRDKDAPVYLDVCGVRNPSSKARNVRYRIACSTGWECTFNLLYDRTIVATAQMEAVCLDAGMLVGLADGRSIGFGRFSVSSYELVE